MRKKGNEERREESVEDNGNPAANTSDDSFFSLNLLVLGHLTVKVTKHSLFSLRRKIPGLSYKRLIVESYL